MNWKRCIEMQMEGWRNQKKVKEASEYLLSNWTAARLRLKHKDGVEGSSTESHVSHSLSSRMSKRPMGWNREGAAKMAVSDQSKPKVKLH